MSETQAFGSAGDEVKAVQLSAGAGCCGESCNDCDPATCCPAGEPCC